MALLKAENLAKAYKGRTVVGNVSLNVNSGEIVGLLGPNGAGKQPHSIWLSALSLVMQVVLLLMMKTSLCYRYMNVRVKA